MPSKKGYEEIKVKRELECNVCEHKFTNVVMWKVYRYSKKIKTKRVIYECPDCYNRETFYAIGP